MKTLLIALFTMISTITIAQNTVTWKGGTPGKETSWNEAKNWSNNKVPNEFSNVIISDISTSTFSTPIIKEGTIELNSIMIESSAQLTVETSAKLIIYGYAEGLMKDNLQLSGSLIVLDEYAENELQNIATTGNSKSN